MEKTIEGEAVAKVQTETLGASRSPFEAGITGGFSLLMDNSNGRNRR